MWIEINKEQDCLTRREIRYYISIQTDIFGSTYCCWSIRSLGTDPSGSNIKATNSLETFSAPGYRETSQAQTNPFYSMNLFIGKPHKLKYHQNQKFAYSQHLIIRKPHKLKYQNQKLALFQVMAIGNLWIHHANLYFADIFNTICPYIV